MARAWKAESVQAGGTLAQIPQEGAVAEGCRGQGSVPQVQLVKILLLITFSICFWA